jgi:hypothetical protein
MEEKRPEANEDNLTDAIKDTQILSKNPAAFRRASLCPAAIPLAS